MTLLAAQVIQSLEFGPEQVAQSAWQEEQVLISALCWLEGQEVHAPAEGWLARILEESEQDKQSFAVAPEQVWQSAWQLEQVFTSALNWLEEQLVQAPAEG